MGFWSTVVVAVLVQIGVAIVLWVCASYLRAAWRRRTGVGRVMMIFDKRAEARPRGRGRRMNGRA
jgi:hypothetical protein